MTSDQTSKYSSLFEPVRIGNLKIRNRIGMAPMNNTTQMDLLTGALNERSVEYYVERARGGVGLIITGVFKVENDIEICKDLQTGILRWPLVTPGSLPVLSEMISRIHGFGARIFFQLSAGPGRVTRADVIKSGVLPVSSSPNNCFFSPDTICRELEIGEIEQIIERFGIVAQMLRVAGADGVDIHGHEGYLLDQFATGIWNRRADRFGGDLLGRSRLAQEIRQSIGKMAGWDFPVSYRLGVKHHIYSDVTDREIGRDIEESIELCGLLSGYGYDALNLDVGAYESGHFAHPPEYQPQGFSLNEISAVAATVSVPVFAAGKLGEPDVALDAVSKHNIDVVLLGRPLLADPYWPTKLSSDPSSIRPCIGCDIACRPTPSGIPLGCSVNPEAGRERELNLTPAMSAKNVTIIGGGVAGLEAARVARLRGHSVKLFEAEQLIGGRLKSISAINSKASIKQLLDWYFAELTRLGVEFYTGRRISANDPELKAAEVLVVATGAVDLQSDNSGSFSASDALQNGVSGDNIHVIGRGGTFGAELALWLAGQKKNVKLSEPGGKPWSGGWWIRSKMLEQNLDKSGVEIELEARAGSASGQTHTVIDIPLRVPDREILNANYSVPVYVVGDADEPRDLHWAIWEGSHAGRAI